MIQSIKVDIVYYMTATDFEFEFNLGSCCHMRLLNDKAKDKKSFVNSLARAVSRSQIIICCGPLFGEDGLIATSAAAISHELQTVNNEEYGISSDNKIEIIEDSLPLVTPEGYFGGCIIESGSQTIILLTENRTLRKSIMKNLIHPYIEDVSLMQSAEKIVSDAKKTEEAQTEETEEAGQAEDETPAEPIAAEETLEETPAEEPAANEPAPQTSFEEAEKPSENTGTPEAAEAAPPADLTNAAAQEVSEDAPEAEVAGVKLTEEKAENSENVAEETETEEVKDNGHNIEFDFSSGEETADPDLKDDKQKSDDASDFNDIFIREDSAPKSEGKKDGVSTSILVTAVCLLLAILAVILVLVFVPLSKGMTTGEYIKDVFGKAVISKYV